MALTQVGKVKQYLGIKGNADDTLLEGLIAAASARISRYLSRTLLEQGAFDLRFNGNGRTVLTLPDWPATVTAVYVNDNAVPSPKFVVERERFLYLLGGYAFAPGVRNIRVVGTAGYAADAIPADLEQACVEYVALRYKEKGRIGEASKSLAGESVSYAKEEMPEAVKSLLRGYMNNLPV